MARQSKKKSKATIKKPSNGTININITSPSTTRAPKSSVAPMRISGGRATGGGARGAFNQAASLAAINELKNQIMLQALQQGTRQGITNKAEVEDLKKQMKDLEAELRKYKKMEEIRNVEGPLSGPPSGVGFSDAASEQSLRSYAFQDLPQRTIENWRRSVASSAASVDNEAPLGNPMHRVQPTIIPFTDPRIIN